MKGECIDISKWPLCCSADIYLVYLSVVLKHLYRKMCSANVLRRKQLACLEILIFVKWCILIPGIRERWSNILNTEIGFYEIFPEGMQSFNINLNNSGHLILFKIFLSGSHSSIPFTFQTVFRHRHQLESRVHLNLVYSLKFPFHSGFNFFSMREVAESHIWSGWVEIPGGCNAKKKRTASDVMNIVVTQCTNSNALET